jgi:manganese/zinc/iron transport system permease protein
VLYGSIENTPLDLIPVVGIMIPRAVLVLGTVLSVNAVFVAVFFKELKLSSFDPSLATSLGFSAKLMHYLLMTLVAVTAVASFESVGNILVVAMFIVPPATAYLLTDRLDLMILLSCSIAAIGAISGHVAAVVVPSWFGFGSTTTAGMMAVMVGLFFTIAMLFAPQRGLVIKWFGNQALSLRILSDDIVAYLYRAEERSEPGVSSTSTTPNDLSKALIVRGWPLRLALFSLRRRKEIGLDSDGYHLQPAGHQHAQELIRSHRLWEQYLATEANVDLDQIHDKAERLEHFTDRRLRDQLDRAMDAPKRDPHGSEIPKEQ